MKTLVIFYSLDGNTKFISEIIARELNADLFELKTEKVYPSSGFKKYFWGGKSVVFKEQPSLTTQIDLTPYQNIIIGTPVWASSYAAPFNTFVKQYPFTGKKVALFACHGGGGAEKCFKMFKEALPNNEFISQLDLVNPLKQDKMKITDKAAEWAKSLPF